MILIGQYDSPFVRRVAIALRLYGMAYDHRPWSTFGDGDKIEPYNPLRRVPTLVLDDGEVLIESTAILDHLDEVADEGAGVGRRLIAASGPERRRALKHCALATGLCDKMVSLVYERILHEATSTVWIERCRQQIADVLDVLEAERAASPAPFWFGDGPGHADIALGCALRFLGEAHPDLFDAERCPALAAHRKRCEALGAFEAVVQRFDPPRR